MADLDSNLKRTEITIRRRVECQERAFHIVNKLIDGCVKEEYLSECGRFISQENYNDIVEERAISMLCGYPVCDESLPNVPKKRYHISTKANKVYDISERKNFCSNQCFKASKVFKQQIPESPVWAREEQTISIVVSPHKAEPGLVGEEVVGRNPSRVLETELERLKALDERAVRKKAKDADCAVDTQTDRHKDLPDVSGNKAVDVSHSIPASKLSSEKSTQFCDKSSNVNELCNDFECINTDNVEKKPQKVESQMEGSVKPGEQSFPQNEGCEILSGSSHVGKDAAMKQVQSKPLSKLEQLQKLMQKKKKVLSKMVDSQEVATALSKDKQQQEIVSPSCEKTSKSPIENVLLEKQSENEKIQVHHPKESLHDTDSSRKSSQSSLQAICQVLKSWMSVRTIEYLQFKRSLTQQKDPQPVNLSDLKVQVDYPDLSLTLGQHENKLNSILGKDCGESSRRADVQKETGAVPDYEELKKEADRLQLKVTEFITGKRPIDDKKKPESSEENIQIPTVDAYDQSQIRAKIVLERLDKVLPDLLTPLGLSVQDVSSSIRELVYTFRLERDTITFKPAEWILVSLFLLKMLSYKVRSVEEGFRKDSAVQYFTVVLKGIQQTLEDLHLCTQEILSDAAVNF